MERLRNLLEKIGEGENYNCGFVGEMILDRFVSVEPERLSREAPVIIYRFLKEEKIPGGGANALNNLLDLGLRVSAATVIGDDEAGEYLLNYFTKKGISSDSFLIPHNRRTTTKTRFVARGSSFPPQQVFRFDLLTEDDFLDETEKSKLKERLLKVIEENEVIVISDYNQFIFNDEVIEIINQHAINKKFLIDSRKNLSQYIGHYFVTPNYEEAVEVVGREDPPESLAKIIKEKLQAKNVVITLGEKGMYYCGESGERFFTRFGNGKVIEVSGAGDTVIAAIALGIAAGLPPDEAVFLSTVAAEAAVRKPGTSTVTLSEIKAMLGN